MAEVALWSTYGRIGFSAESYVMITDAQGIDCTEEIDILTDGEIENLCKVIRRPVGINLITNVSNLGLQVFFRAENNLKLDRFFLKHKIRTGSVAIATDITLDNVRLLRELKKREKEHTDPLVFLEIDVKNWPKNIESLEEYLRGIIGVKGIPLSYVVRSKEAVAPSLDELEKSLFLAEDKMVARAPMFRVV